MNTRIFNRIHVDYSNKTILKSSWNKEKLRNEINYYLNLPKEIACFFPSILSYRRDYSAYRLELIPYDSLSNLILNNKISYEEGTKIIDCLMSILDKMHSCNGKNTINKDIGNFCIEKTLSRIDELNKTEFFEKFSKTAYFEVNNTKIRNFNNIKNNFINLLKNSNFNYYTDTVIHGDYCFSNILYCPEKKI